MTTAKEWRKAREEGIEHVFPSGNVAMIRPLDVGFFVRNKKIPSVLVSYVNEMINSGSRPTLSPLEELENVEDFIKFLDDLAIESFVSPSVKEVGQPLSDDDISIEDISHIDKRRLWGLFGLPARSLIDFRDEQKRTLEIVASTANNTDASKQTIQDKIVVFPEARNA